MTKAKVYSSLLSLVVIGACSDTPVGPSAVDITPQFHAGAPASSCPLAQLPASARVLTCFTTTLLPGVLHGFALEVSDAQPGGAVNGAFDRSRLNHDYILAAPEGFRRVTPTDPVALPPGEDLYIFQAEYNGTFWLDVLRLMSATGGTVPVVVFLVNLTGLAGDVTTQVENLASFGVVNAGQANALTRKIDQARSLIAKGDTVGAITVLEGFIQQLRDLAYVDFAIPAAEAEQLITLAQLMIDTI